ncbi:MAG: hypothetical protein AAGF87_00860 [Bacteroidota bacterium]
MKNQLHLLLLAILVCCSCGKADQDKPLSLINQEEKVVPDAAAEPKLILDQWSPLSLLTVSTNELAYSSGMDIGDINGDGLMDIVFGNRYFLATAEEESDWGIKKIDGAFDGHTIMFLGDERGTGLVGMDGARLIQLLPDLDDPNLMTAKIVAQLPKHRGSDMRAYKKVQIVTGGAEELLITGREGIYMVEADDMEEWSVSLIGPDAHYGQFATGDIDRDGDEDLAAAIAVGDDYDLVWFENPGDGSQYWNDHPLRQSIGLVDQIGLAQLDADDRLDVILTNASQSSEELLELRVFMQQDTGWAQQDVLVTASDITFDLGDLDGDEDVDIASIHDDGETGTSLWVWENNARGDFAARMVADNLNHANRMQLSDVDQDGDLDLLYTQSAGDVVLSLLVNKAIP